jgi:hypothetical protein
MKKSALHAQPVKESIGKCSKRFKKSTLSHSKGLLTNFQKDEKVSITRYAKPFNGSNGKCSKRQKSQLYTLLYTVKTG